MGEWVLGDINTIVAYVIIVVIVVHLFESQPPSLHQFGYDNIKRGNLSSIVAYPIPSLPVVVVLRH